MKDHQEVGTRGPVALGVCLAVASMGAGSLALAQTGTRADDVRVIDEIIVTVRKIDERAQDVPLSIVVYDSVRIERERLLRTEDVARLTPGVTFDRGAFPNDTRPAMRGMQNERGRPSVAVLVDGHDLSGSNLALPGGSGTLNLALHDLERIEIVKGPQSTLYGRNAFGGAINYITRAPEFEFGGRAGIDIGNDGRREVTGSLTGPLVGDTLAFRLNVAHLESDGHYTNPVNGGPLGAEEATGVALGLRFEPTATFSLTTRYQYIDRDESDNPTAFIPSNTRLPVPGTELTRATFTGPIRAGVEDVQMGLDPITGEPPAGMAMRQHIGSWEMDWATELGTFVYMGAWLQNDTVINQDGDFTDFPVTDPFAFAISAYQSLDYTTRHLNHELRWTHVTGPFNWIAGVQKFDETAELVNDSQYWLRNPDSFLGGPPFFLATQPLQDVEFPVFTQRRTDYLGVFAGVNRDLGERFRVSLQARWNRDEVDYFTSGWGLEDITLMRVAPGCDPTLPQQAPLEPGVINACPQTATHSSRQVTPRATVEYRVSDQVLVYVSHARGFKPGGYETLEITNFEGRQFRPEKLKAYEAGIKSSWLDNRLVVNADVYFNDYTDQQIGVQQIDLNTGFATSRITNAGKVEVLGLELVANWRATDNTTVGLAYAWTDAEFKEFIQGPGAPPADLPLEEALAVFAACGVPPGQTSSPIVRVEAGNACGDFSGNRVAKSPRHALNANVFHRRPLGASGNHVFMQASTAYRSRRYVDESNLTWLPGYMLVDLQAGVESDRWTLTAYVDNVFDNDRIITAQRNVDFGRPDGFAPSRAFNAYLPAPRLYGLRFALNFN